MPLFVQNLMFLSSSATENFKLSSILGKTEKNLKFALKLM